MGSRAIEKDCSFWHQAYQDHGPSLLAFLASRVGRRETAEEFLQETFVRAMRRVSGDAPGANLRSYLFTTAHHLLISDWRRTRPRLFSELSGSEQASVAEPAAVAEHSAESALDLAKVRERIEGALATLSPAQRAAFRSAVLEQKPYAEVAREQGCTPAQVKVNVHRARKKVMAMLADLAGPAKERPA